MLTQNAFDNLFLQKAIKKCDVGIIVFDTNTVVGLIDKEAIFSFSMARTNLGVLENVPTDSATVEVNWDKLTTNVKNNLIKGRTVNVAFGIDNNLTSDAIAFVIENVKVDYAEHKANITLNSPFSLYTSGSQDAGMLLYENGDWVGDSHTFPAHITYGQTIQHLAINYGNGRRVNPVVATTYVSYPTPSVVTLGSTANILFFNALNVYKNSIKRYYDENDRSQITAFGVDTSEETMLVQVEAYNYMKVIKLEEQCAITRIECEVEVSGEWVGAGAVIDTIYSNRVDVHCTWTSYNHYRFRLYGYKGNVNVPDTTKKYLKCYCWLDSQTVKLTNAQTVARSYYSHNTYYEFDCRLDPRIEPQDVIFVNGIGMLVVEEVKLNFNGGFSGHIKGRLLSTTYALRDPEVHISSYNPDSFSFTIDNDNPFVCSVKIFYSDSDYYTLTVPANSTITVNNSNCPLLYSSFSAYESRDLNDYVTCRFESAYGDSDSTIILEANA